MSNKLIPFGKYKGQPVEQLQNDPEYAKWLLAQPWFASRYSGIHTLIVNNFKDAADSPEHNVLQARLLDRRFAFQVFCAGYQAKELPNFEIWESTKLRDFRNTMLNVDELCEYEIEFEVKGWDAVVHAMYVAWGNPDSYRSLYPREIKWGGTLQIEVKPTIGEDFPTVLRQVKSRGGKGCVLVEDFACESVPFEQVREIFATSRFRGASGVVLLRCCDVPELDLPECFES